MKKSRIATLIVFFVLIPLTLIVGSRLSGRAFYVTSTLVIVELLIPFFLAFEGRRPQARELVVLAVMCALAVAGRELPLARNRAFWWGQSAHWQAISSTAKAPTRHGR